VNIRIITSIGVGGSLAVLGLSAPTNSVQSGNDKDVLSAVVKHVDQTVEHVSNELTGTVHNVTSTVDASLKTEIEHATTSETAALKKELTQQTANVKVRLSGNRLRLCQARQASINTLLHKSADTSKNQLTKMTKVQQSVETYYKKQKLSHAGYAAAAAHANELQAKAASVVAVTNDQTFTCSTADANRPAAMIVLLNQIRRTALGSYRDALISLINVVKDAKKAA
jgi:hypothetical protein